MGCQCPLPISVPKKWQQESLIFYMTQLEEKTSPPPLAFTRVKSIHLMCKTNQTKAIGYDIVEN
jgi:hypothetical protein